MKLGRAFFFFLISLPCWGSANLITPSKCESTEQIKKRAKEELCQQILESTENCFAQMNFNFAKLAKVQPIKKNKKLQKIYEGDKSKLLAQYETGLSISKDHLPLLKKRKCLRQHVAVQTLVEEMKKDRRQIQLDFLK